MFIGMEQLKLSNLRLAGEALSAAYSMCDSDPLLINEMGVMAFSQGKSVHPSTTVQLIPYCF